jgi:uncharacterized protein (DUF2267 family)
MAMEHCELSGLETTVHKTHEWLRDIARALGVDDPHFAYGALRAVLHELRDRLAVEEAAHFGAQLPMLIRGLYYEGWRPTGKPASSGKAELFAAIRRQLRGPDRLHPEIIARAVLTVIARHVSAGEVRDVTAVLPQEWRELWPQHGPAAAPAR